MIRSRLNLGGRGQRRGVVRGLLLGVLLGGGGAWLAAGRPGLPDPGRWLDTTEVAPMGVVAPAASAAPSPADLLGPGTDAPLRVLELVRLAAADAYVRRVVGDADGDYFMEGLAPDADSLATTLDRLRRRALSARLTHWQAGADTDVSFRFSGRLAGEPQPSPVVLGPGDAAALEQEVAALAVARGMTSVTLRAAPDSSLGAGLQHRRCLLAAQGTAAQVGAVLRGVAGLGERGRLSRVEVVPGTALYHLTVTIDMVVARAGDSP